MYVVDICTDKAERYVSSASPIPRRELVQYYEQSPTFTENATALLRGGAFCFVGCEIRTLAYGKCGWAVIVAPPKGSDTHLHLHRTYAASHYQQIKLCTLRAFRIFFQNRRAIIARTFRAIIIGLLLGTLFWQMDTNQSGASNRASLLFYCITFMVLIRHRAMIAR